MLLSGGADGRIVLWDSESGEVLRVLRTGHRTGGVLALAVEPVEGGEEEEEKGKEGKVKKVWSAGSDRTIRRYTLSVANVNWKEEGEENDVVFSFHEFDPDNPIIIHETSVSALAFSCFPSLDTLSTNTLWTASVDGTAKQLTLPLSDIHPTITTVLEHASPLRALALDPCGEWVITAGRDEVLMLWEALSG